MKIEPRTFTLPNGEVLTVRSLCADDAEALSAFRNAISSETHFMARYPEEGASLEAMRNWLAGYGESPVNFEVGAFAGEKRAVCLYQRRRVSGKRPRGLCRPA